MGISCLRLRAKFIAYHYYHLTPNLARSRRLCDDNGNGVRTHSSYKVCQALYTCMKLIWYEYEVDERILSLHNSMIHVKNLHTHLQTWPRLLYYDDSRVRTQSYDCPPHIKYVKLLLYVWTGSGVSMQGMGGPNHILQHVPSENPLKILRLAQPLLEWWYSMVLWHYGCQPWLKAFKHFL